MYEWKMSILGAAYVITLSILANSRNCNTKYIDIFESISNSSTSTHVYILALLVAITAIQIHSYTDYTAEL